MLPKKEKKIRRHKRIRSKVKGTSSCPRLSVFHSNSHIYCQIIDDEKGETLAAANDLGLKTKNERKTTKTKVAFEVGKLIAEKAKEKGIKKVVFDRGGYQYHGKVKALADGAREGGLEF
ncbi:MAG TPA: 50S ribosomal protein L18 [Candidatus Pacearchaeota archaeon]|nr:50S ribosomal protein L18 [Candidatus Pacearchaeota archaeon]HOK94056.1 50S ribosomal protein L18 [Candidatus Pacearchaeota archaeon]HPO75127.1 50S ribosomal protein L18 [Candidatus Pacearchaeota archaeon]